MKERRKIERTTERKVERNKGRKEIKNKKERKNKGRIKESKVITIDNHGAQVAPLILVL